MTIVKVSSKGQITIPAAIRKQEGFSSGTRVSIELHNGVIELRRVLTIIDVEGIFHEASIGKGNDYHRIREEAMAIEAAEIAREGLE